MLNDPHTTLDPDHRFMPAQRTVLVLSNDAVSRLVFIVSSILIAGIVISGLAVLFGEASFSSLLLAACLTAPLCLLSGVLARQGKRRPAFVCLYSGLLLGCLHGVFIRGYGVHAPSLTGLIVPCALAFAMFRLREAVAWGTSVLLVVLGVFGLDAIAHTAAGSDLLPALWNQKPPAANQMLSLVGTLLFIAALGQIAWRESTRTLRKSEQSREQLQSALDRLDEAEIAQREREKFMGQLSHEIRTPLAALRNAVSLMKHPKSTPAMKERSVALIDATSADLLSLLNDALDSFKFGNDLFSLNLASFNLFKTITEVSKLYGPVARTKGIMLTVDMSGVKSTALVGDPQRLRQMLSNLVGNAIKFTERGEVRIRVSSPGPDSMGLWRFEVMDTGPGIAADKLERLFKPFSQVHDVERSSAVGTGLGLSIVQQLAQSMNGRVGVSSTVGQGSVFWFEVLLMSEMEPDARQSA